MQIPTTDIKPTPTANECNTNLQPAPIEQEYQLSQIRLNNYHTPESTDIIILPNSKILSIKSIPLLLSEISWIIYILIFIWIGFFFPRYHPSQTFISQSSSLYPWNSNSTPFIFSHVTDLHISTSYIKRTINYLSMLSKYKPDFYLITGDLVDNYGGKIKFPRVGHQTEDDWIYYRNLTNAFLGENKTIIDLAGNHDMFAIDSLFSKHNYFLDYSYSFDRNNTLTKNDFLCKIVNIKNLTFVLINPYSFPTVHPPFNFWSRPSSQDLDLFENTIDNAGDCYIALHYPVDQVWRWKKSSKGHTFEQIMQKKNIKAIFTGHDHPIEQRIIHHKKGGVEYVGTGPYNKGGFNLVSIDNGRLVYHTYWLDKDKLPLFIITHPVPLEQISDHHVFNDKHTEIRVISFGDKPLVLKVKGDIKGTLNLVKLIDNGIYLYSMPLHLEYGKYTIKVYTDEGYKYKVKRKFVIGDTYIGKKELTICKQRGFLFFKIAFGLTFVCLFIALCPILSKSLLFPEVDQWIQGKINKSQWSKVLLLSPFILRTRILKLNATIRNGVFLCFIYILLMPHHVFKPIYGKIAFSFFIFINVNGTIWYDEWALHMSFIFLIGVIIPVTLYISSLQYKGKTWIYWFNYFLLFGLFCGIGYGNYRWMGESVDGWALLLNPIFVLIPIGLNVFIYTHQNERNDKKLKGIKNSKLNNETKLKSGNNNNLKPSL